MANLLLTNATAIDQLVAATRDNQQLGQIHDNVRNIAEAILGGRHALEYDAESEGISRLLYLLTTSLSGSSNNTSDSQSARGRSSTPSLSSSSSSSPPQQRPLFVSSLLGEECAQITRVIRRRATLGGHSIEYFTPAPISKRITAGLADTGVSYAFGVMRTMTMMQERTGRGERGDEDTPFTSTTPLTTTTTTITTVPMIGANDTRQGGRTLLSPTATEILGPYSPYHLQHRTQSLRNQSIRDDQEEQEAEEDEDRDDNDNQTSTHLPEPRSSSSLSSSASSSTERQPTHLQVLKAVATSSMHARTSAAKALLFLLRFWRRVIVASVGGKIRDSVSSLLSTISTTTRNTSNTADTQTSATPTTTTTSTSILAQVFPFISSTALAVLTPGVLASLADIAGAYFLLTGKSFSPIPRIWGFETVRRAVFTPEDIGWRLSAKRAAVLILFRIALQNMAICVKGLWAITQHRRRQRLEVRLHELQEEQQQLRRQQLRQRRRHEGGEEEAEEERKAGEGEFVSEEEGEHEEEGESIDDRTACDRGDLRVPHVPAHVYNRNTVGAGGGTTTTTITTSSSSGSGSGSGGVPRSCALCLQPRRFPTCTPCGHIFCWACVVRWCIKKPQCPLCRQKCQPQQLLCLHGYD